MTNIALLVISVTCFWIVFATVLVMAAVMMAAWFDQRVEKHNGR